MPRKFQLNWDKTNKWWFKYVNGKKLYLIKAKGKWNKEDYETALDLWNTYLLSEENKGSKKRKNKKEKRKDLKPDKRGFRPKNTIVGVMDRYIQHNMNRVKSGLISETRLGSIRWVMRKFIFFLDRDRKYSQRENGVELINAERIDGWRKYLDGLMSKKEIGAISANELLNTVKAFVEWAYSKDYIKNDPKYLRTIDGFKKAPLKEIKTWNVDQVRALFENVRDTPKWRCMKLYICLALNCGFSSNEISTLAYQDLDFENRMIKKKRVKTGQYSEWSMWEITYKLLINHLEMSKKNSPIKDPDNPDRILVFKTVNGKPLRWTNHHLVGGSSLVEGSRFMNVDSLGKRFDFLKKKTFPGVSNLPTFRALRATGATELEKLVPENSIIVARMYLSHSLNDIFSKHYHKIDLSQMTDPLMKMEKVFDLKWEAPEKVKRKARKNDKEVEKEK